MIAPRTSPPLADHLRRLDQVLLLIDRPRLVLLPCLRPPVPRPLPDRARARLLATLGRSVSVAGWREDLRR